MKILSFIKFLATLILITQVSCTEKNEVNVLSSELNINKILDSIGETNVIASYIEEKSVAVIQRTTNNNTYRLIFREGIPPYADSLINIKPNEYRSPKHNTTYLIKDSTVLMIQYAKIIHPSSNWQGQTPWSQPYVTIFDRIDIGNK